MGYPVLSSATQIRVDLARELVDVPEWKLSVWLYELTGAEMDEYRRPMYKIKGTDISLDMKENTLRLLALAIRDESGQRVWDSAEEGVKALGALGNAPIERLGSIARKLSNMGGNNDAEGNSEAEKTAASSSGLQVTSATP